MIDPSDITDFDRTESELQEFFLFTVVVAGKTAYIQANKLEMFLKNAWLKSMTPFEYIDYLIKKDHLREMVCEVKLGQYNRLTTVFKNSTKLDLSTVTTDELEKIPGIGPKTSRFFLLHSRPNQKFAVLDTHVLTWLGENVANLVVPKTTPQSPSRYKTLESIFLKEAKKRNITPEDFDLQIWNEKGRKAAA